MALLRVASTLPASHFHQVTVSASQLLLLLLSKVTDITQISTSEAAMHFNHITDMMNLPSLSTDVRQVLGNILMSLTYVLGDEAKAAREAQMMHTLQLALGKSDVVGTNSDRDLVTCGLLFHAMVSTFIY
jgi:mediator of RNA polymerase II transcription subunit 5